MRLGLHARANREMSKQEYLSLLQNAEEILSGEKSLSLPQFNEYLRFAAKYKVFEKGDKTMLVPEGVKERLGEQNEGDGKESGVPVPVPLPLTATPPPPNTQKQTYIKQSTVHHKSSTVPASAAAGITLNGGGAGGLWNGEEKQGAEENQGAQTTPMQTKLKQLAEARMAAARERAGEVEVGRGKKRTFDEMEASQA